MKMWDKLEINWTVLLTVPCVAAIRGGGLLLLHPRFPKGCLPSSSTEPQAAEEGWQTWIRAQGSQDSPSTVHTQHLHCFLTPLITSMQWRNKSPQAEAAGASESSAGLCWHPYLLLLLLRTLPTGRKSQDIFFQRGESSTGAEVAFPEHPEMVLTQPPASPQGQCKHCHPSLINKPGAKSLTRVLGAQDCYELLQHKAQTLQFGMIYQHLCEPGFPQPHLHGYWSAKQGDKSLHQ